MNKMTENMTKSSITFLLYLKLHETIEIQKTFGKTKHVIFLILNFEFITHFRVLAHKVMS